MKDIKTTVIQIKLTEKEKEKLKSNADANGMSISQYIRTKCIYRRGK